MLNICNSIIATNDEKSKPFTAGINRLIGARMGRVKLLSTPEIGVFGFTQLRMACMSIA